MRTLAVLLLCAPSGALAATLSVSSDPSADFDNIQDALGAAEDGDTIALGHGQWGFVDIPNDRSIDISGDPSQPGQVELAGISVKGPMSAVQIDGISIRGVQSAIEVRDGSLSLTNAQIEDSGSQFMSPIRATSGAHLEFDHVSVSRNIGADGVVQIDEAASLRIRSSALEDNRAERGGAISIIAGQADIEQTRMARNTALTDGGHISLIDGGLHLADVGMDAGSATRGGSIFADANATLDMSDSSSTAATADDGGHIWLAGSATLIRTQMARGTAINGGGVMMTGGTMTAHNTLIAGMDNVDTGAGMYIEAGSLDLRSSVVFDNKAVTGSGIVVRHGDAELRGVVLSNLNNHPAMELGDGAMSMEGCLMWDNGSRGLVGNINIGARVSWNDPKFVDPWQGDFALSTGSPGLDTGDDSSLDPDGTSADMGIYGGAHATPLADDDDDGFVYGRDCDDADPDTNEQATDAWYDGIDSNCDGANDFDQDGDSYDAASFGGADCDDTNANINPDAIELEADHVDMDCDGFDLPDADDDGWASDTDCDEEDPNVNPGAEERWYDGEDRNCDGADDFDQDGDGFVFHAWGGEDCDDEDATIHPGVSDADNDGIDQNCDGVDGIAEEDDVSFGQGADFNSINPAPTGEVEEGDSVMATTGCSTAAGSAFPAAWLLLGSLGLITRRRKED